MWRITDAGRTSSRRPRQTNDCTVRALALSVGLSYDEAYDYLAAKGRKCGKGFHLEILLNKWPGVDKLSFPAKKGEPRMSLASFVTSHPSGTYVVRTAKHVQAVINGVIHDTHATRLSRCVYTAWQINSIERSEFDGKQALRVFD